MKEPHSNRPKLDDLDKKIAESLKFHRLHRGLSQQAVACEIGCSYQQVQKYETGTNRISTGRLFKLCRALAISPNEIFFATSKYIN